VVLKNIIKLRNFKGTRYLKAAFTLAYFNTKRSVFNAPASRFCSISASLIVAKMLALLAHAEGD